MTNPAARLVPGSFRDPSGFLFWQDGSLYRHVNVAYRDNYDHLMNSGLYKHLTDAGLLISHEEVTIYPPVPHQSYKVIKPELVPFISYPYGDSRNSQGNLATDKLFTGQRLDGTGLYYYGARFYDPEIGRFISADTLVPNENNPQALNRYSYVLNNPLRYVDPTGHGSGAYWGPSTGGPLVQVGTSTVVGVTYIIYQRANGTSFMYDRGSGGSTGSTTMQGLVGMTRGYMEENKDYGVGGNARTGAVVTMNFNANTGVRVETPVHFVSEDWVSYNRKWFPDSPRNLKEALNYPGELSHALTEGTYAATVMASYGAVGISVNFEGGAFIRDVYMNQRYGGTPEWLSNYMGSTVVHESFHYWEQGGALHVDLGWYYKYIRDIPWRDAAEARAKDWAQNNNRFVQMPVP